MMPTPRIPLDDLFDWARSPNGATIAATRLADRELDVLLDRLWQRINA